MDNFLNNHKDHPNQHKNWDNSIIKISNGKRATVEAILGLEERKINTKEQSCENQSPAFKQESYSLSPLFSHISTKESTWKITKNAFYFTEKSFFLSRDIKLCVLPTFPRFSVCHCWIYRKSWLKINLKNYVNIMRLNWNLKIQIVYILRRKEGIILELRQLTKHYIREIFWWENMQQMFTWS